MDPGFLVAINSMLDSERFQGGYFQIHQPKKIIDFLRISETNKSQVGRLSLTPRERFIRQRHHGERCHCGLREGETAKAEVISRTGPL